MRSRRDGDRRVITLAGELDIATAQTLERELELALAGDVRVTVLDLRELEFIDSNGLRVIVEAHRRAAGALVVVKRPGPVERAFELCGLLEVFTFADDVRPRGDARRGGRSAASDVADRAARRVRSATERRVNQAALAAAVRDLRSHRRLQINP